MRASVGIGLGPIRLSQGLGLGGVAGLIVAGAVLLPMATVNGFAAIPVTDLPDGHYVVEKVAPEGMKVIAGKYRTTTPTKPKVTGYTFVDQCRWWVSDSNGKTLSEGKPKPGKTVTVTLNSGDDFLTEACGAWTYVPAGNA